MSEHTEDDEDVPNHSDGNETTQDENGKDSLPVMIFRWVSFMKIMPLLVFYTHNVQHIIARINYDENKVDKVDR